MKRTARTLEPRTSTNGVRPTAASGVRWLAAAALACTAFACDSPQDAPADTLAGPGEACVETAECSSGLQCVAFSCLAVAAPTSDAQGDGGMADAGAADAAAQGGADGAADAAEPVDAGPPAPSTDPDDVDDQTPAISGRVLYSVDNTPISSALVTGAPGLGQVLTNADGEYLFLGTEGAPVTAGAIYEISASRAAFEDGSVYVTAKAGHNRDVDILLEPVVAQIPLGANPSTLTFDLSTFGGSSTAMKQVKLFLNPGMPELGSVDFTVSIPQHDGIWLSVKPVSGKVGKATFTLIVTVDRAGLAGGAQGSFDVVPATGDPLTIPVTVVGGAP